MTDSILRELSFKSQILHRRTMAANGRNKETHKATRSTQCSSFSKKECYVFNQELSIYSPKLFNKYDYFSFFCPVL